MEKIPTPAKVGIISALVLIGIYVTFGLIWQATRSRRIARGPAPTAGKIIPSGRSAGLWQNSATRLAEVRRLRETKDRTAVPLPAKFAVRGDDKTFRPARVEALGEIGAPAGVQALTVVLENAGDLELRGAALKTVTPEPTDELLPNPGIGWQTCHVVKTRDKNLPGWLPSTVHYVRWGWGKLEPQAGRLDSGYLDRVLQDTREAGQQLAFRVMCCSTTPDDPYYPKWLKDAGGRMAETQFANGPTVSVPDFDHPVVLERHLDFIKRLGARYDGHPDLDHVDIGSVGWWGEWHMSGAKNVKMPTPDNQRKILDAYLAAFKKTQLLMPIGGDRMLAYAAQQGCGWRADCLGDMRGDLKTWDHMRKGYPDLIKGARIQDAWKTAPVAWESGWDMRHWVKQKWPLRFIFNYALALHGSYLNNKSTPLPEGPEVRAEIERFVRRLGYRLVLREMKHPAHVKAGGALSLSMKWQNVGSAPCYQSFRVAYRLSDTKGFSKVLAGRVTVEKWLPGSVPLFTQEFFKGEWELPGGEVMAESDTVEVPANVPAGTYTLSVAVVGVASLQPAVRLGIKGRGQDGWYPVSSLRVAR